MAHERRGSSNPVAAGRSYLFGGMVVGPRHTLALVESRGYDLAALLARVARGDMNALATVYDQTVPAVYGLVLRILGDRSAAEEVTADVFVQVWQRAVDYDPRRGPALPWLLLIARSRALDRWRNVYNFDRPHEALDQQVPASRYRPSSRPMPDRLPAVEYDEHEIVRLVPASKDYISFKGRPWIVPRAFRGERALLVRARIIDLEEPAARVGYRDTRASHVERRQLARFDVRRLAHSHCSSCHASTPVR